MTDQKSAKIRAERGTWSKPIEFTLSCLGLTVGLGNFWRFPYMCYQNGGGAFLVPYTVMLAFAGLPLFFLELSLGQYAGSGPISLWELAPLFKGVGVGMMIICFMTNVYYNMIIAWSLYYLLASWQKVVPWEVCSHDFNTEYPGYYTTGSNNSFTQNVTSRRTSASEEYFNLGVLGRSGAIDDFGEVKWSLVLALFGAWIVVFLCVIKGIRSSGKVVYFTAIAPYILLLIFLVRGAMLKGSLEGIKFYIIPTWEKLAEPKVWADAANQIFFSLALAYGALTSMSSYNHLHNNVFKDSIIVAVGNCSTSLMAGFVVFSVLGHLAHVLGKNVDEIATSGSGLAFVAYAEVVTYLEPPQLWATILFLILFLLGLDSQFAGIESIVTCTMDLNPNLRPYRFWVTLTNIGVYFVVGLLLCTQAGLYWVDLISYYGTGWSMMLLGLAELLIIGWIYGANRLKKDIEYMIGHDLSKYWLFCWMGISPLILTVVFILTVKEFRPLSYGDYFIPAWAQCIGWLLAFLPIAAIPASALCVILKSDKELPVQKVSNVSEVGSRFCS
ncbi:hypothetical protein CAPTEDRAFT_109384 [Capitella teleta]|uniref:Transporter n=1 Tax=Capitella teleta TaxID=283909 RepID=R7V2M1_CAPTE|nr:hypothetical protein CAPTEDRAFT_109384 [Capitella teleta]|eukprot:ELU12784.1 hypothetical protein CAPTEDRAFT_109384 [Capitella teleta]